MDHSTELLTLHSLQIRKILSNAHDMKPNLQHIQAFKGYFVEYKYFYNYCITIQGSSTLQPKFYQMVYRYI